MKGIKLDQNKPNWSLLPYKEVEQIVQVLTFGAKKYQGKDNWKRVPEARERYFSALMRHLTSWWGGEHRDEETGLSHLAHAGCCLLFLMWLNDNNKGGEN